MKYLEDSRLTQLTSDLTGAFLNTRGSGNGGGSSFGTVKNSSRSRSNKCKKKNGQKQPTSGSGGLEGKQGASPRKNNKQAPQRSTSPAYYAYNPVGYSTYNNGGAYSDAASSSSCRVIYGRVEAYTTKRAGSDKKTAFEVGERYAHEMERFNEAVEALKQRHAFERQEREKEIERAEESDSKGAQVRGGKGVADTKNGGSKVSSKKIEQRRRSRSLDGVTFAASVSPRIATYDASANASETLAPLEEGAETLTSHVKRDLPLEGILKQPSSNKRCRSTSFDISTGPSTFSSSRKYHHSESSSSLLAGSTWTNRGMDHFPLSVVHPTVASVNSVEDDRKVLHPLIPQPSLYQSSLSEHDHTGSSGEKKSSSMPTMVPRRLVTDLILTLNASFPDYDFGDAQVSDFCTLSISEAMRRINSKLGEFAATTDEGSDFLPRFWSSLDDVLGGLKECDVYSYAPREGSTGEDDPMEFLTMSMAVDEADSDDSGEVAKTSGSDDGIIGIQGSDAPAVVFSPSGGGRIVSGDLLSSDLDADDMALDLPNQISPSSNFSDNSPPHVTLWSMNYFFVSRNKKRIVLFACVQTMRTPRGNEGDYDEDFLSNKYSNEYGENNVVFDEARREDGIVRMQQNSSSNMEDNRWMSIMNSVPSSRTDKESDAKAQFSMALPTGDSESVNMVEDTDVDYDNEQEGVDVEDDDDDDVEQSENDFDTGTLSVPSQAA